MWEIQLLGPDDVLAELSRGLARKDPTVVKLPDRYVLRASAFATMADADSVRVEAQRIVESLSGIARLLLGSGVPVGVGSVAEVRADGSRSIYVQLQGASLTITGGLMSTSVTRANGTIEEHHPSDPAAGWLLAALKDRNLAKALRLLDAGEVSWTALYRIFEVVEAAIGETVIVSKGWASRSEIRRFSHSAHSVAVAGDKARHGIETTQPPAQPMSLSAAKALIDSLLQKWIEETAA